MRMHITPEVFQELIKKSYNLDIIYLLKLIDQEHDVTPMYENSMKISALYQSLVRKGLITNEDKLTLIGKDLLNFIKNDDNSDIKIVKRKPITVDFEEWWKNYPSTDSFTANNQVFKGTRSLRRGKEECKRKFKSILEEGDYTTLQLIESLKFEVTNRIERSLSEKKNILSFMQGSIPYLNQRSFEGFIEMMQNEKDAPSQKPSGSTDI
jgi:hypothetical protein